MPEEAEATAGLVQKGSSSGGTGQGRAAALLPWNGDRNMDAVKTVATLVYASVLIS